MPSPCGARAAPGARACATAAVLNSHPGSSSLLVLHIVASPAVPTEPGVTPGVARTGRDVRRRALPRRGGGDGVQFRRAAHRSAADPQNSAGKAVQFAFALPFVAPRFDSHCGASCMAR